MNSISIKDLFTDHRESLLFPCLSIGSSIATPSQWSDVVSLLSSQYKFSLDRGTIASSLYSDIMPIPMNSKGISMKNGIGYYVRYDCIHNQDAAVFKLLSITKKTDREFVGSIYPDVVHILCKTMSGTCLSLILFPKTKELSKFKQNWDLLYRYTRGNYKLINYITYMESL